MKIIKPLVSLAATWSRGKMPATQAERNAAVKAIPIAERGKLSITAAREYCEHLSNAFTGRRTNRTTSRIITRLGLIAKSGVGNQTLISAGPANGSYSHIPMPTHGTPSRTAVRLPYGTPADRVDALRERAVIEARNWCLRSGAAGGTSTTIILTDDPARIGYKLVMSQNWNTYAGSAKKYPAAEDHHTITVPRAWRMRVERRGLARLDGMLTLDAAPLDARGEIELFAAVWVSQARGYGVEMHRGVIARCGKITYHADTLGTAMRGIQQKLAWARLPREQREAKIAALRGDDPEILAKRYANFNVEVCVSDAESVGACAYGIKSWCNAVGLDYEAGCAPIAAVLAGYVARPQPEARAAILHAVRRHREQTKLAA